MSNSDLQLPPGALPVPESQQLAGVKLWCEYGIWGLLFYDDQSPWLTVVECLHICFDRARRGQPVLEEPSSGAQETVRYGLPLNYHLRHLLFRDRDILEIAGSPRDDRAQWRAWAELLERDQIELDFGYLRESFGSFRDMANAVELLRSAEIESHTAKRWSSRHLLPLGQTLLFPDVDKAGKLDRKFMRRTGELLYLMLSRSQARAALAELVTQRLLGARTPWEAIARRLAGPDGGDEATTSLGYLPLPQHSTYDTLAEDWVALLRLEGVPIENLLDPLQRMSGLAQALYILKRAAETVGDDAPLPAFFLDVVGAPGGNALRKLSNDMHKRHRTLIPDARASFIDHFAGSEEWRAVLASDAGPQLAHALLKRRFQWDPPRTGGAEILPPADLQLEQLRTEVQSSRGHNISTAFLNHVKHIGLLRAHRRSGTWYAPNDSFLEALVLATVTSPMEFGEFLQVLLHRYNIVVGPEEVRRAFRVTTGALPAPLADLQENERRLEERLRVLGFLDRKSDDCAFVINPFHKPAVGAVPLVAA